MNPQNESEKSSAQPSEEKRKPHLFRTRKVYRTDSLWNGWERDRIVDIEFEGEKFKAAWCTYSNGILVGKNLRDRPPTNNSFFVGSKISGHDSAFSLSQASMSTAGSCAYARFYPTYDKKWKWWLYNIHLPKGSIAFLTRADAGYPTEGWEQRLEELHQTMKTRGFTVASVNKSNHTGHYPVWLYVHRGDDAINAERAKKNKNKNKAVKTDADVLGNSTASIDSSGTIGNIVASEPANPVVPDAYALSA